MQAALKKICKSLQFSAFLPKNTELTIKKFRKKIRQRQTKPKKSPRYLLLKVQFSRLHRPVSDVHSQ